ncbi:MAG: hypothetical protein HQL37_12830 [Alphaproteobacteria bacterium]|nr:hypothetical protein [Alphaproteobacteria bacterium]
MIPAPFETQSLPGQESLLLDYVHRLERHTKGRRAVHIHLSELEPRNRQPKRIQSAVVGFRDLLRQPHSQLFELGNLDLIVIFKDEFADAVESAIIKLQFVFAADALMENRIEDETSGFATFYDLQTEYELFLQLAQRLAAEENVRQTAVVVAKEETSTALARNQHRDPLSPGLLIQMENALAQADLSNLMRRQSICAIVGKSPPQPVFTELFVSINELRDTMMPKVDLASDRWLFHHLTDTLDRRVLSMLYKNDDKTLDSDFSINLNASSMVGQGFLKFDDNIKTGARSSIVLEIQVTTILADPNAYCFARDFARESGYRVCVDGVTLSSLPYVNRGRLGADLIKLFWHPSMSHLALADTGQFFRTLLKRNGLKRIILSRCESPDAIETGRILGITLFQGHHIDEILAGESRRSRPGPYASKGRKDNFL